MKRVKTYIAAALAAIVAVFGSGIQALATDVQTTDMQTTDGQTTDAQAEGVSDWPEEPEVNGESAIVMDMESGVVIYEKEVDKSQYPASITKLLTALIAIENSEMTDRVVFSEDSVYCLEYGDAHIGMRAGEELSMRDALYGMMLASANEVAYAIAETVGKNIAMQEEGSAFVEEEDSRKYYDIFIEKMNERAEELGATNSHFVNPNGLHDENHYTTAHDMAVIAAELFKHKEAVDMMKTRSHKIEPTNLVEEERYVAQNHGMLSEESEYYYENYAGGKTGYTEEAKNTLVTYADNGDMQLVCVALKTGPNHVYQDTRAMFDYVYDNFRKVPVKDALRETKMEKDISRMDSSGYLVLPNAMQPGQVKTALTVTDVKTGEGFLECSCHGHEVGNIPVTAKESYLIKTGLKEDPNAQKTEASKTGSNPVVRLALILLGAVALLSSIAVALSAYLGHKRKQERIRRRRRISRQRNRSSKETDFIN